jgi:hypothetical protein
MTAAEPAGLSDAAGYASSMPLLPARETRSTFVMAVRTPTPCGPNISNHHKLGEALHDESNCCIGVVVGGSGAP